MMLLPPVVAARPLRGLSARSGFASAFGTLRPSGSAFGTPSDGGFQLEPLETYCFPHEGPL